MRFASRSLVSCFQTLTYLSPRSQPPSTFPNRPPLRELFSAGQVEPQALGGQTRTACLFRERLGGRPVLSKSGTRLAMNGAEIRKVGMRLE